MDFSERFFREFADPSTWSGTVFYGVGFFIAALIASHGLRLAVSHLVERHGGEDIDLTSITFFAQVVRVGIEADHDRVGEKLSHFVIRAIGLEDFVVDARQKILPKAAEGFGRAVNDTEVGAETSASRSSRSPATAAGGVMSGFSMLPL